MTPSKRAHLSIQGIYKWHQMPMNKKKRETRKKKKKKNTLILTSIQLTNYRH